MTNPDASPARATVLSDVAAFADLLPPAGRLLGLDLGTRTIGLALSDVTRLIASPLETLKRVKLKVDAEKLVAIVTEHRIVGLVLGLPVNLDGTEGPRAQSTRAFSRNIATLHPTLPPLLLWDERLTTQAAERLLIEADQSRKRRAEVIDKMAAALILQSALDRIGRL